jgi:hypothetical protein
MISPYQEARCNFFARRRSYELIEQVDEWDKNLRIGGPKHTVLRFVQM